MEDHKIVSKGEPSIAVLTVIQNTHKIIDEKVQEEPKTTMDASLYTRDVGFLLDLLKER